MSTQEMTETIGFKQCHNCSKNLLDRDKFCRHCGVNQSGRLDLSTSDTGSVAERTDSFNYKTQPLSSGGLLRRSYSDPLVSIVTQELSARTSSLHANRWAIRLVSTLVAVPLWLMIVLLSPLDAYVAAKAIARQV